jgi:ribonuclease Z
MSLTRRLLLGVVILAIAAFAASFLLRIQIAGFIFDRAVKQNFGVDREAELGDGLHVFVCGAGTPLPDPKRNGPCMAVIAGPHHFVIDAGSGGARTKDRRDLADPSALGSYGWSGRAADAGLGEWRA